MVEEDFLMKNYKKSDKIGHFEFFYLEKEVTITVKFFRAFSL